MRVPNIDLFNYLFSFNFASLKYLFYFIKDLFYNCFLTKEGFLYSKQVGWNFNFLNMFNFLKTIVIFIWEQLTKYIPFLEVFEWLFVFLKICLDYFKKMMDELKHIFMKVPEILVSKSLLTTAAVSTAGYSCLKILSMGAGAALAGFATDGAATNIGAEGGKKVYEFFADTSEKTATAIEKAVMYTIKVLFMVISFTFKIMLIIGKSLITIVLKFLDIFYLFLKIWYRFIRIFLFIVKAFIIIIYLIMFIYCDDTTEDPLIKTIRKELYKKEK
jgi:hypothetical protein